MRRFRSFLLVVSLLVVCLPATSSMALLALGKSNLLAPRKVHAQKVVVGWEYWYPMQYSLDNDRTGYTTITGLDIELSRFIFDEAGYSTRYVSQSWSKQLQGLKSGKLGIMLSAFYTKERAKFAYFSIPYRHETDVLYVPTQKKKAYRFRNDKELLAYLKTGHFKLGVVKGYAYGSDLLDDYIANPKNQANIVRVDSDVDNFHNLLIHRIDGFLIDRVVGESLAWHHHWQHRIVAYPGFYITNKIHFMLSKKVFSQATVDKINKLIVTLKAQRPYRKIVQRYTFPILLSITLGTDWFRWIGIFGTMAFALLGAVTAWEQRFSFIGALILAALPPLGGGIIRDILTNQDPIGIFQTPHNMFIVVLMVLIVYVVSHISNRVMQRRQPGQPLPRFYKTVGAWITDRRWIPFFSAFGVGSYTILGVIIAMEASLSPLWLYGPMIAFITGIAGYLVMEIVLGNPDIPLLKGQAQLELPIVWGWLLSMFIEWQTDRLNPNEIFYAIMVIWIGGIFSRLLLEKFKVKSIPYY